MSLKYEVKITPECLFYYRHGWAYRDDGPAMIWKDGDMFYTNFKKFKVYWGK